MLLAGAGLLIRSYLRLEAVHLGYSPSTLTMDICIDGVHKSRSNKSIFISKLFQRLAKCLESLKLALQTPSR